jgi:hypothetical protein
MLLFMENVGISFEKKINIFNFGYLPYVRTVFIQLR